MSALAPDAVTIRRARARGLTDFELRREAARVVTPRVERFVFLKRLTIRAQAGAIGAALESALASIAAVEADARYESFADFAALACACARETVSGEARAPWRWIALGLPDCASGEDRVAALLALHPLEATASIAALRDAGLLAPIWRGMSEAAARSMVEAIAFATGVPLPPLDPVSARSESSTTLPSRQDALLLSRAVAFWAPALPGSGEPEKRRAAAMASLLLWRPQALRDTSGALWRLLLGALTVADYTPAMLDVEAPHLKLGAKNSDPSPASTPEARFESQHPTVSPLEQKVPVSQPTRVVDPAAPEDFSAKPARGRDIHTLWGGVLFFINGLRRLDIEEKLAALGAEAPSGWRLLLDLALAYDAPADDPLLLYFADLDLETESPPALLQELLGGLETLYAEEGPWPPPLAQAATLHATESHLDLYLHTEIVDMKLRLAGLDLDPGWTPWLGRVVAFHYDRLPHTMAAREFR